MDRKMEMLDFFGMEASEYLEKLDGLVSGGQRPETVEFVRLARALRGSAMMASQHVIADAASALESFARSLHQTEVDWDAASRQVVIRTVDDLKIVVRRLAEWDEGDESRIRAITADLQGLAGGAAPTTLKDPGGLDTGTRAFIGREGSAVASALHRASQTAGPGTASGEVLNAILTAIQPLRGIASLSEVPPMPDLLDGVERVASSCKRQPDHRIPQLKEILHMGAEAISRVAREVAATGKPEFDSDEAAQFARLLRRAFEGEGMVIPIEDLYFADDGPHIVTMGAVPDAKLLDPVELVARGEHLRLAADSLDQAGSATQYDLRLQALEAELVMLARAAGNDVSSAVSDLARKFHGMIDSLQDKSDAALIAGKLRSIATVLANAATLEEDSLIAQLQVIGAEMAPHAPVAEPTTAEPTMAEPTVSEPTIAEPTAAEPEAAESEPVAEVPAPMDAIGLPEAEPETEPETPAQQLEEPTAEPADEHVEPIGAERDDLPFLTPPEAFDEPEEPGIAPAVEAPAPDESVAAEPAGHAAADIEGTDLAASYALYELLVSTEEDAEASLETLLAGPPAIPAAPLPMAEPEPAPETFQPEPEHVPEPEEAAPLPVLETAAAPSESADSITQDEASPEDVVPIEELLVPVTDFCYSGRAALEHALSLGDQLREAVENRESPEAARELIDEVLDLIELGIGTTAS